MSLDITHTEGLRGSGLGVVHPGQYPGIESNLTELRPSNRLIRLASTIIYILILVISIFIAGHVCSRYNMRSMAPRRRALP